MCINLFIIDKLVYRIKKKQTLLTNCNSDEGAGDENLLSELLCCKRKRITTVVL